MKFITKTLSFHRFVAALLIFHASAASAVALIDSESILRLSEYDRNILLLGPPSHKIQMSVKEQPFDDFGIFLTYTQVMFWQNLKGEGPFREVNFNPALFYRWTSGSSAFFTALDFGVFDHKSNGEGGPSRRSYNDTFIELHADHKLGMVSLLWTTRISALYGLDFENQDLRSYFGFWQTSLAYIVHDVSIFKLIEFYGTIHPGGKFGDKMNLGSEEVGLRFKIGEKRAIPYIFIQYFNGYGEGLSTYNHSTSSFRAGFQL